ncbi:Aspartate aminotransferase [Desulfonema limicola]|uniref:Aminotransferase n=1 Tax=Desulfonema limicola TaxID=45656 RepID=A0A975GEC6_9BACT|nr:pyridoxal phosphate-dependent aminotransferase [Desulfonema limicola]QTA78073.1 Aspartate aminotransferase [Desulfonema limicola]
MTIAEKIGSAITKSSWIRKMFEQGALLKAEHGPGNVFDFSLGNPNVQPPEQFFQVLRDMAGRPGSHAYMPNTGYPDVCQSIAQYLCKEQDSDVNAKDIIMTCGAAGALNVILKTILDPGDEVITPAPYFVEYNAYADNHQGVLKTVKTNPDFTLNLEAVEPAVSDKTKAVLINSPNNPTGQIYSEQSLKELGNLLTKKGKEFNRTIYLLSDEPYRKIVYDQAVVPGIFKCYKESIIATSYSKDLSIPGERLGFIAVNPEASYKSDLLAGMGLANRILGFVNAPAFMQRIVSCLQGVSVDISEYARKRKLLCEGLAECGYEFITPPGAFYLFPKTPIPDDVEFVKELQQELILAVPGSGFGGPGHFRLAFCVDDETIINSLPGFKKVMAKYK